jgi:hypothetical protein
MPPWRTATLWAAPRLKNEIIERSIEMTGQYEKMAVHMALGTGIGSAFGAAFHNIPIGVAIGIAIGAAVGAAWR